MTILQSHKSVFFLAPLVVLTCFAPLASLPHAQPANSDSLVATYARGKLHVSIPYDATRTGMGKLIVEVLDPEDSVVGHFDRRVDVSAGRGVWKQDLQLPKTLTVEDLVWHRLRYQFTYSDDKAAALHEIVSISQVFRNPVVHVLGQQAYLSGGPAAVRLIVTDGNNEIVTGPGSVQIELMTPGRTQLLYTGKLNQRGTSEAQFRFPADLTGKCSLHYVVDTAIGSAESTQDIRLDDKVSILLTTEKPLYQPSQTIHVRALALDRASHEATAGRKLTFELEDSRGNKVFRKVTQTDAYGIASAEFGLADEVNLGTYHLRALMEETAGGPQNNAEIALQVERYVLPKFKVAVDLSGKDARTKRGYRPGDHVMGTVRANYFFGKAVDRAEVTVKASAMDVAQFEAGTTNGKTDADGAFQFDIRLPNYFAGRQLNQGAARVLIEATVKDNAGHSETRGEPITVSDSPLLITAVPESGELIPGLENQVFILTSYPDGTPAQTAVRIHAPGSAEQSARTDAGGVAVVQLHGGAGDTTLQVEATDHEGNKASSSIPLESRSGADQVLLRTDRAVYRTGERIQLQVLSTRHSGTAYVDVIKAGQTVATRDLDIVNGRADFAFAATPDLAGTVEFNAYVFGRDALPVADHRLVFVQPADELKIETTLDAAVYKPGGEARIDFRVTNTHGEGVQAALGLQIVDEAVFALAEKQPGFAKVFFYLEQEVMKPRYEIHSIGLPDAISSSEPAQSSQRDRAARALFSATELVIADKSELEFGRVTTQTKYSEYAARYGKRFHAQVEQIAEAINHSFKRNSDTCDVTRLVVGLDGADGAKLIDPWGNKVRFENTGWSQNAGYFVVRSAGPDGQFSTGDDLTERLEVHECTVPDFLNSGEVDIDLEHERGPFNSQAEIAGSVKGTAGSAIPGATVTVLDLVGARRRTITADAAGRFHLAGVHPGDYEIQVSGAGFATAARRFSLKVRDRAIISVVLCIGATLSGTVTDSSNAVVPDANVVLKDEAGQTVRESASNGSGFFRFQAILPGSYTLTVSAPGFTTWEERAISLTTGASINIPNIVLQVGGTMSEVAVVSANDVIVPTDTGQNNTTLNQHMITQLSLAGRDAAALIKVMPGMAVSKGGLGNMSGGPPPEAHVRSWFPEALYIAPEIITDRNGRASITIPIADSITTWRMAMLASTAHGTLGSGTSSLKVFQDFFVDLDLPVTLTQGDQVSIPVAVYNYSGSRGDVSLRLQPDDWFSMVEDAPDKSLAVDSGRVGGSQFTIQAKRIGKFKLTLSARMSGSARRADIVIREIEVVPNGREQSMVFNGRLEKTIEHRLDFPSASIPDASAIFVRLYPGPLSQVIEGMDSLLRMPFGCFEQTSSSTYPNILALDYIKRTKKLAPEVHAKAEGYIANGYQRLLTFEVPGGGFSWFGNVPANKILTSYGLMEFSDMSKVYDVDPKVIQRTQQWLASEQQSDGSWKPDTQFINEGATNRYNTDTMRITAYIAWALENTGYQGTAVERARQFIETNLGRNSSARPDVYTLAVLANFATDYAKDPALIEQTMQMLSTARTEQDGKIWWKAEETGVYATGTSAAIETTGLAVQALLKWGGDPAGAAKAISYIVANKDAAGTWGTTQATIMALRALLLSTEKGGATAEGPVEIFLNGRSVATLDLTADNNDLLHQFVFKGSDVQSANVLEVRFAG